MRFSLLISVAALFLAQGCTHNPQTSESVPLVSLAEVSSASDAAQAYFIGRTEARNATDLSFMVMGTVDKVLVKEGDAVRKGQELARLDTRDYQTQLDATLSEYNQIKAECERVMAMHAEHAVSDNDYDKARSGLERITAKLNHHRAQLNDCVITAPYNGYVERIMRHTNEVAAPGVPVITIFSSGGMDIIINIPERDYLRRNKAESYYATFSSLPDRRFELSPSSVSSSANANQLYEMHLALGDDASITPGMTAMVEVNYAGEKDGHELVVPLGALKDDGVQTYVYRYNAETESISMVDVKVKKMRNDGYAIVSGNIRVGDQVVASGVHYLTDGQQVRTVANPSALNVGNVL